MINFGLRLTLSGGRKALTRLLVIAGAVAVGVTMLLVVLSGINGVTSQDARGAWMRGSGPAPTAGTPSDPAWVLSGTDTFHSKEIIRIDVAATGPHSPVPPGLTRLPGPGEYFASPALQRLLRDAPAAELADRYPGRDAGTFGAAGLPSPDSLIIVVGHAPQELSGADKVQQISSIATAGDTYVTNMIKLTLGVIAVALIIPVLTLIGMATRMSAARREQRYAAMRLVGATPKQVSVVSAVESTVAAAIGTVLGFALFTAFRSPLSEVPYSGVRFHLVDFRLGLTDVLVVGLGVPLAAAVAARVALRRVRISPLGVSRRATPAAPRAWRVLPLLAGVAELAWFVGRRPPTVNGQLAAYLAGAVIIMLGLQIAGPWLTYRGARLMAGRARRPAALIAARRLADDPKAGFRAVSGLVLALFVTSAAIGIITTMTARQGMPEAMQHNPMLTSSVIVDFGSEEGGPAIPDAFADRLRAVPGVRGVVPVHANPAFDPNVNPGPGTDPASVVNPGLAACADLARVPGVGHCAPGATVAEVTQELTGDFFGDPSLAAGHVWRTADVPADRLEQLPMLTVVVTTDGSRAAIEQARTLLEAAYPLRPYAPYLRTEFFSTNQRLLRQYQQLTEVIIVVSLIIAGCGLAVSVVGGLNDRKRPFSLLRLTGVQLSTLRRVLVLESAVPLLGVAVVATVTGFVAADLFLRAQLQYTLRPPDLGYYLTVGGGLAATAAIVASALPLLRRITGPETARNE